MTIVAVMADPPVPGIAFSNLRETVGGADAAARLYRAALADVCRTVQSTGADLLVNHGPSDRYEDVDDPAESIQESLDDLLESPDSVRYEVQVGDTWAGRVGNTVTYLLETEDRDSVVVLTPGAAFISREELGAAGMKLRSTELVLGPDPAGGVYLAGFTEPIDFDGAYDPPALETLTERGLAAELDVDFLRTLPVVQTAEQLGPALVQMRARRRAGRKIPPGFAAIVEELDLGVTDDDGTLAITRSDNP